MKDLSLVSHGFPVSGYWACSVFRNKNCFFIEGGVKRYMLPPSKPEKPFLEAAMGRIATALFIFMLFPAVALAQAPICDATCQPDPQSPGYSNTLQVRTTAYNARGMRTPVARPAANSQVAPAVSALPGSESYNYAIPILSLPGRNGLDLNLTLYYNSRVWTIDKTNLTATFNADRDFPSYGFRLGYGYMEYDSTNDIYTLTESDGSKRQLAFVTTNIYDSNDASFMRYYSDVRILRYKNGTNLPTTMLHETFHGMTFGVDDIELANAANVPYDQNVPDPEKAASDAFSREMEKNCWP
jgi:hypothetical protein